jgi:hypothetical protein
VTIPAAIFDRAMPAEASCSPAGCTEGEITAE